MHLVPQGIWIHAALASTNPLCSSAKNISPSLFFGEAELPLSDEVHC